MRNKGRLNIVVDVAKADHSDFDVTELYVRLADEKTAALLRDRRGYRSFPTSIGLLLLPRYRLEIDENVSFDIKQFWIFRKIIMQGIRL